ncbi:unnamed protein product [Soboliphyme baturini]|uniref:Cystatin domain-containing protein n=1 Tax=Soboliphyme baturini TaxID=241478 RepID=A0A183J6H6_9BILA|nr:unnamed protein product [Soboliphyme baturini]
MNYLFVTLAAFVAAASNESAKNMGPLVGAPADTSLHSPEVVEAADISVKKINADSKGDAYRAMLTLEKASKQVVAGVMYHLELQVAETVCSKAQVLKKIRI